MGEKRERTFWVRCVPSGGGVPQDFGYRPRSDDFPEFIVSLPRSENGFTLSLWRKTFATTAAWQPGPLSAPGPADGYAIYEEIRPSEQVYVPYAVDDRQLGDWTGPPPP